MPIEYQQIHTQIKAIGAGVKERARRKEEAQAKARELLGHHSALLDELRAKVDSARQMDSNTRCASPLAENLAGAFPPPAASSTPVTLIAADGSQIFPDRHAAEQYFVINVGALVMQVGSGNAPEIFTDSEIHLLEEFDDQFFSDSQVALQRDVAERKKLLELAQNNSGTLIALTEGQLELWGATDPDNDRDFQKSLLDYLNALKQLEQRRVITCGYVDKPAANWVVRLLEIAACPEIKEIKKYRPLAGVTDLWLFSQLLGRHERSALFKLQAKSAAKYTDGIAIHFFYLNVGDQQKPKIARVDIPLWVVEDPQVLKQLHAALIEQVNIMGGVKPFPYLLHRAHEVAVVTHREKAEIDQMLALAIRNSGGEVGEVSGKQSAKDLPTRTRR